MKAAARTGKTHRIELIEAELAELGEECARVVMLLRRLAKARSRGRDVSGVLGELVAAVVHLHVHTKGLDRLIDELDSE